MNSKTIERIMNSADNTPKGQVRGKKISGNKERKTKNYWSDVNRIVRKKEKKVRFSSHRIEEQPDEADIILENIHYADYLGQKDISDLPQFNSVETITISKKDPQQEQVQEQEQERDQFSAWDDPVWESESNDHITGGTLEGIFLFMPQYNGNPEMYDLLQTKFKEVQTVARTYAYLLEAYKSGNDISDNDSDYSYDSHGRY
jgi:hypothetical protein